MPFVLFMHGSLLTRKKKESAITDSLRAIDEARTRDLHLGKVAYYQLYYYRIYYRFYAVDIN